MKKLAHPQVLTYLSNFIIQFLSSKDMSLIVDMPEKNIYNLLVAVFNIISLCEFSAIMQEVQLPGRSHLERLCGNATWRVKGLETT